MANPIKGEVGFSVGEGRFTLAYDFNALCTMEGDLDVSIEDVGTKMDSISAVRTMFRIGLEAHHGRLSDIEAGNLIHQLGLEEAGALITKAFQGAFPDASAGGKAKPANKATRGSGRGR
ncbi:hypothetical protein [Sphingomonas sp. CCH9-F2]|jgi:hypothetical protein|uniref:hypothetical protein n=1 Tax=Sphingomonas sp. CCH9-F2 TaxID=1768778 RepID=UPI00083062D0|nr:hypothetical protein [Sphingomonas sp. CCH9-F2]